MQKDWGGVAQVVEHLSCKHKALISLPSRVLQKMKKEEEEEEENKDKENEEEEKEKS
jgi:hypothetical protein